VVKGCLYNDCIPSINSHQLADNTELLRVATASAGDLVEYFVNEDDWLQPGSGN
jgi:hypothetical protein